MTWASWTSGWVALPPHLQQQPSHAEWDRLSRRTCPTTAFRSNAASGKGAQNVKKAKSKTNKKASYLEGKVHIFFNTNTARQNDHFPDVNAFIQTLNRYGCDTQKQWNQWNVLRIICFFQEFFLHVSGTWSCPCANDSGSRWTGCSCWSCEVTLKHKTRGHQATRKRKTQG